FSHQKIRIYPKTLSDGYIMQQFGEQLATAVESELPAIVEEQMELEKIISYIVVDRAIRHDDGPFHWYCSGGGCSNHNYYWYEEPESGKLHLIPWDLDNAFENIINNNNNAITAILDDWGEISNNCEPFSSIWFGLQQRSAACDPLTAAWVSFEAEYEQLRQQFFQGPCSETIVNQKIDQWAAQIRSATAEANDTHNDAISVTTWEQAVARLKEQIDYARN
ncbi:MAG: CotH kinase family protein, partial [Bacteroidota bacterium]